MARRFHIVQNYQHSGSSTVYYEYSRGIEELNYKSDQPRIG
ncbi:MAG: hypothetical protein ACTSUE_17165 [Promethearchaeota archaeon]